MACKFSSYAEVSYQKKFRNKKARPCAIIEETTERLLYKNLRVIYTAIA